MLLNKKHTRDYINRRVAELRPGWNMTSVSSVVYLILEAKLKRTIDRALKAHSSGIKTFKDIL